MNNIFFFSMMQKHLYLSLTWWMIEHHYQSLKWCISTIPVADASCMNNVFCFSIMRQQHLQHNLSLAWCVRNRCFLWHNALESCWKNHNVQFDIIIIQKRMWLLRGSKINIFNRLSLIQNFGNSQSIRDEYTLGNIVD